MTKAKMSAATVIRTRRNDGRASVRHNKRDTQYENRCQRFVEVAQELFLERGFAGASVNEVVRRAGGSLATLYAEFGTKDDLFEAVMKRRAAMMFADIINSKFQAPDMSTELLQLAQRLQTHMLSDDALALHRLVVHEGPKFPSVRKALLINGLKGFLQRLGEYFAALEECGRMEIDDPSVAADLFVTLVQGQLRTIAACGDAHRLTRRLRESHVKRAVEVFLRIYPTSTEKRKQT